MVSLISLYTFISIDSSPNLAVYGESEMIESIRAFVSAICDDISALMCYPNTSAFSTAEKSSIFDL